MISKGTEYAIRALVYIDIQNKKGERPGFREISREIESPEQFTAKILQTLTRHGLINSMKGRGGGFFFNDPDKVLTLHEVVKALEGEQFFDKCIFGFKNCDHENPCPLHDDFIKIWEDFKDLLKRETIQSLAEKIEKEEAVLNRLNINK